MLMFLAQFASSYLYHPLRVCMRLRSHLTQPPAFSSECFGAGRVCMSLLKKTSHGSWCLKCLKEPNAEWRDAKVFDVRTHSWHESIQLLLIFCFVRSFPWKRDNSGLKTLWKISTKHAAGSQLAALKVTTIQNSPISSSDFTKWRFS